ncbi:MULTISPECIES: class I SAM-dependent methyltransferase [unclassified Nitratiruptor]|uniref:class I SAM-dependent methyltransferase n=1 Tax=unclassified Nitratiruptor TaxID=2624044 RepID=UPI001915CA8C|nr:MULTISPECIES: class I SAM-dependent methyltransferase [unclassified Nitratiruptor]BCD59400.1 methyltransferase [Nitratiruptor sp. YY08-10]BCD63324.1 methyltransferase [Nitratiruptor sp. YY08-14]
MPKEQLFDQNFNYYDRWFDEHDTIYQTELKAIKKILPSFQKGIEIGVGTGRFAAPLGIKKGVEPSKKMAQIAKQRGVEVIEAYAEHLPFEDKSFDFVLMVTTICFVDDIDKTLQEAKRILTDNGYLLIAFVDRDSELGTMYEKNKDKSRFYKEATFFSKKEIFRLLKKHGFVLEKCAEALFGSDLDHLSYEIYDGCKKGGAFLALLARKK